MASPGSFDVYLSYSRADVELVRRLHSALVARGKTVWIDWEAIPPAADWRDALESGIDEAAAFVIVLSPDWLASEVNQDELRRALESGKRILPVVRREVDSSTVPPEVAQLNWILLRETDDFDQGVETLVAALETDLEWLKEHARLFGRALEWERSGRDRSYLLRGTELQQAERWLAEAVAGGHREPATPLHTEFVLASAQRAIPRLRRRVRGAEKAAQREPLAAPPVSATPGGPGFDIRARAVSDMPSRSDVLGFRPIVQGLRALLNDDHTTLPLAVALTAPWGAGKSSVMIQLRAALEQPTPGQRFRWYSVQFDAWKYERSERMWAALAKAIYDDVQGKMARRQRALFRVRLERERQGLRQYVAKAAGPPLAAVGAVGVGLSSLGESAGLPVVLGGVAAVLASAGRYWGVLGDPFKRSIDHYASRPKYEEQLGFTPDAEHEVRSLIRVLGCEQTDARGRRKEGALAIFLDDLDRCSAKHVVEVVEAINQIFNAAEGRRCVFVLGMDRDVVAASIDVAYKDTVESLAARGSPLGTNFGRHFLAKIVQMSVAVPEPDDPAMERLLTQITGNERPAANGGAPRPAARDVERFRSIIRDRRPANPVDVEQITDTIRHDASLSDRDQAALAEAKRMERGELFSGDSEDVAAAEFEVLRHLGRNPRTLKRFDNALRLQLHVANGTPGCRLDFDRDQLVALGKWVGMRLLWPDLALALDDAPRLLEALEAHANAAEGDAEDAAVDGWPASYGRWFEDPALGRLLEEPNPSRRVSTLPLESFLQIV